MFFYSLEGNGDDEPFFSLPPFDSLSTSRPCSLFPLSSSSKKLSAAAR